MKARVKETGKIVEVQVDNKFCHVIENGSFTKCYYTDELDFNIDTTQKQSVTIEGFVHKDHRDGTIWLMRNESGTSLRLPTDSFPDLHWEEEPQKVKITIEEI